MGATDPNGRPFPPADLERQKAGLRDLQLRLLRLSPHAFSLPFIQQAHAQLAGGVLQLHPGEFRHTEITFGTFYGTRPHEITDELDRLVHRHHTDWATIERDPDPDPQTIRQHAAWVHAELIRIHPMYDGNGRLARALEAWLCWQQQVQPPQYPDRTTYHLGISRYCRTGTLDALMAAAWTEGSS